MDYSKWLEPAHNPSMRKEPPNAKDNDVTKARLTDLMRAGEQMPEIFFLAAMQKPISRVRARIERLDQAEIAIDADQDHRAVNAMPLYVGRMMIWRPDPSSGLRDHGGALGGLISHGRSVGVFGAFTAMSRGGPIHICIVAQSAKAIARL